MPQKSILLNAEEMRRAITRMAHEVVERNNGATDVVFAGLLTRGVPLAQRMANTIELIERIQVPIGFLDINLYRDDLNDRPQPLVRPTTFPVNIDNKRIIIIDDVLFTGRSARAALDALTDLGRPKSIQLAALIDRGHREVPIRADYVGKNVPTSPQETVRVHVQEIDGKDEVILSIESAKESYNGKP
jgi:pyrimidine operon attenuation protein/uracil phosphoribosyltransferase